MAKDKIKAKAVDKYNPIEPIGKEGIIQRKAGEMHVIVIGDIKLGFSLIGAFMEASQARHWAQAHFIYEHAIMPVNAPADVLKKRKEQEEEDRKAGY